MGRPAKFGEVTQAIRVPASKVPEIQQFLSGQSFVQNSEAGEMVQQLLTQCRAENIDPRRILFNLQFRSLCQTLDKFTPQEQMEFIARLCDRYLITYDP